MPAIAEAFDFSSALARERLDAEGIDVVFIDAPSEAIPEWGVGGYTYGSHVIVVAMDAAADIDGRWITSTLVHEFHHAMRERGPGCGGMLADMFASEGLAVLFEEEVTGAPPFYCQVDLREDEVALARASLYSLPYRQSKWFFGADGVTRGFGYAFGYAVCRAYATSRSLSAAELLVVPPDALFPRADDR